MAVRSVLISGYRLLDIKNYEMTNKVSVIDMLGSLRLSDLAELVRLGNSNISKSEAYELLSEYFVDHDMGDAIEEIRDNLFPKPANDSEDKTEHDLNTNKNLTEFYRCIGDVVRDSGGLSFSEFWNLTTEDLFEEIALNEKRLLNKRQSEINFAHMQGAFLGMAMAGKLEPEPPRIDKKREDLSKYKGKLGSGSIRMLEIIDNMKL